MADLKPCPFCDIGPFKSVAWGIPYAECRTVDCAMFGKCVPVKQWENRPDIKVVSPSESDNIASDEIADYDCGIINDYGGGNVQWWQDYLRYEINCCNEYWRSATSHVA